MSTENLPLPAELPEAERLRQFCLAILDLLNDAGESSALPGALVRAIGAGVEEVADGIRAEADALASAANELDKLPSHYLVRPPAVDHLLAELEAARTRAVRIADALSGFHSVGECEQVGTVVRHSVAARRGAADYVGEPFAASARTEEQPETATEEVPVESEVKRAARIYRDAQRCHKNQDLSGAEDLYTSALEVDSCFGPAYSRRGQVRLAQGKVSEAIADFTVAIELDETAAEAWWWRGDAHAVAGRLDHAIDDYMQALELRPDLERARFNLTVAQRRKAEAAAPPPMAPAPIRMLPPTQLPAPAASPIPSSPRIPLGEQKSVANLTVKCPHCSVPGAVPWDRLGKIFVCSGCKRRFTVGADGIAIEVVEAPGGKWVEAKKVAEGKKRRRKKRLTVVAAIAVALVAPTIGIAGWRAVQPAAAAGERALPDELPARVELFSQAWLSNDVRLMKRLTSPALEKVLYSWYNRHRPPIGYRNTTDGTPPDGAVIEVSQRPGSRAGQALVRVRIVNPKLAPDQPTIEMTLAWEERSDGWYFLPPGK